MSTIFSETKNMTATWVIVPGAGGVKSFQPSAVGGTMKTHVSIEIFYERGQKGDVTGSPQKSQSRISEGGGGCTPENYRDHPGSLSQLFS